MIDGVEGERPSNTTPMTTNNIKEQEATKTKSTNLRWRQMTTGTTRRKDEDCRLWN